MYWVLDIFSPSPIECHFICTLPIGMVIQILQGSQKQQTWAHSEVKIPLKATNSYNVPVRLHDSNFTRFKQSIIPQLDRCVWRDLWASSFSCGVPPSFLSWRRCCRASSPAASWTHRLSTQHSQYGHPAAVSVVYVCSVYMYVYLYHKVWFITACAQCFTQNHDLWDGKVGDMMLLGWESNTLLLYKYMTEVCKAWGGKLEVRGGKSQVPPPSVWNAGTYHSWW